MKINTEGYAEDDSDGGVYMGSEHDDDDENYNGENADYDSDDYDDDEEEEEDNYSNEYDDDNNENYGNEDHNIKKDKHVDNNGLSPKEANLPNHEKPPHPSANSSSPSTDNKINLSSMAKSHCGDKYELASELPKKTAEETTDKNALPLTRTIAEHDMKPKKNQGLLHQCSSSVCSENEDQNLRVS